MKEKQIERMANELAHHCPDLVENCCGDTSCVSCLTRFLYIAGYRKQSEGEWVKVYSNEIATVYECSCCKHLTFGTSDYCICGAKMKGGEQE